MVQGGLQKRLRDNGLSIAMMVLFAVSFLGHTLTGWADYNEEQREKHEQSASLSEYLTTGHYLETVFENWESEFLQMGVYVALTAVLYQRGSPESKDPDKPEEEKIEPGPKPWAVRRGGVWLWLYERSLSIVLLLLFLLSWLAHGWGGLKEYNSDRQFFHEPPVTLGVYMRSARFWFESFQNWQSEFLSIAAIVVLSIYLRQKGSSQSKPVEAPHSQTGD
jgi:hypothetical protein